MPQNLICFLVLSTALFAQGSVPAVPVELENWACGAVYYVANTGSITFGDGSLANPWKTITYAVDQVTPTRGTPQTINVRGGAYGPGNGESFPLKLPARGIKLQAYEPGVIIQGDGTNPVIRVDRPGRESGPFGRTPDTVIMGLRVQGGSNGIELDASKAVAVPSTPDRVRVRSCSIVRNLENGIWIKTRENGRSRYVIEECNIGRNGFNGSLFGTGIGIVEMVDEWALSSTLIRANTIQNHATDIEISCSDEDPDVCQPRIASNFIRDARRGVLLVSCSAYLVNNTQGYGRTIPASNLNVFGVQLMGFGTHTVANNIMWNPDSYTGGMGIAIDYNLSQFAGNTNEDTNTILDNGDPYPQFVAPPAALHLLPTSPLIDAGTNGVVLPPLTLSVGSMTVRADVGLDIDIGPRVIDYDRDGQADVEIGADELTGSPDFPVSLEVLSGADELGNVVTGGNPTTVTFELKARPGDDCAIYLWHRLGKDPLVQNVFDDPLGNWLIDVNSAFDVDLLGSGVADLTGSFLLPAIFDPGGLLFERHVFVQGVASVGSRLQGDLTNRRRLEINE